MSIMDNCRSLDFNKSQTTHQQASEFEDIEEVLLEALLQE